MRVEGLSCLVKTYAFELIDKWSQEQYRKGYLAIPLLRS